MAEQRIPEDIVICIDASRSMYRTDYDPNRLISCITAAKTLISERFVKDNLSSFAIVRISDKPEQVINFRNSTYRDNLYDALNSFQIGGYSPLGDALALSIKTVVAELRKAGAKTPRIILISDGKMMKSEADPLKMARLAEGLNIKIDTFLIGEIEQKNLLKRVSDITGGRYFYNNDAESLVRSAKEIADDNYKRYGYNDKSLSENPVFLRKIAAPLLRVQDLTEDQEQRIKQIRGEVDFKKCTICFSDKNPYTQGSFYVTGRYCPNCSTPFHIHCLAAWADSQKDYTVKQSGTARCPHCFYLLKIPKEVSQIQKLRILTKVKQEEPSKKPDIVPARFIENVETLGEEALYKSCPVCHYIFERKQNVIQCGNSACNTLYHEECFRKLIEGHCKDCGVKLHLF